MNKADGTTRSDTFAPLLAIKGLSVEFPSRAGPVRACSDLTFQVGRGEVVGLVGGSGSGKSVAALSVLRLTPPPGRVSQGSIRFEGRELTTLAPREMLGLRGRRIGFVSQTPRASLNPALRIRDQIAAVLRASGPGFRPTEAPARIEALLAPLGFAEPDRVAASFPHQLSGGMCQRVAIALALAGDPALLIADEPTTALDVAVQAEILALLRRLNRERGLSILLVTHDLSVVRALADRVVVVHGGEVQESGPTEAVLSRPKRPYTRALLAAIPDPDAAPRRGGGSAKSAPLVAAEGLVKRFRAGGFGRTRPVAAVDGVSLSIGKGQTLALVGASGSGKSTLARLLMRLLEPDAGRVVFEGQDLTGLGPRALSKARRGFQMVFQDPLLSLNPRRSVGDNLRRPLANAGIGGTEADDRIEALLRDVGLEPDKAARFPGEISGGQCQRVAIARALALSPRFLVLDEPVSALDVSVQAQILDLLLDLQDRLGLAYLFVTHDLKLVRLMAREAAVMHRGRLVEQGPSEAVLTAPAHPYTQSLLRGVLRLDAPPDWDALAAVPPEPETSHPAP
ncbi:MAG: ABC transporter ATP-binding protein [Pseudomonadota bacterium]